jgi:hypothetical protein
LGSNSIAILNNNNNNNNKFFITANSVKEGLTIVIVIALLKTRYRGHICGQRQQFGNPKH